MDMTAHSVGKPAQALLLGPRDPPPFELHNPDGRGCALFVCDHAGRAIPEALGTLGLDETALARHIAWDIGIAELTRRLATDRRRRRCWPPTPGW